METIFLAIFAFGALFTLASAALGAVSGLDHGFGHAQVHAQGAHAASPIHNWMHSTPPLNGSSLMAFLTCFGAAGYLLTRLSPWAFPAVVLGAFIGGAIGAVIVARFLGLVLAGEREMDPDDYRLAGTVGRVTVPIPAGGTGEVVFSKVGARRSEAARSLGGTPIPRGAEVVITDYVDGKAIVQPWAEFIAGRDSVPALDNREAF